MVEPTAVLEVVAAGVLLVEVSEAAVAEGAAQLLAALKVSSIAAAEVKVLLEREAEVALTGVAVIPASHPGCLAPETPTQ